MAEPRNEAYCTVSPSFCRDRFVYTSLLMEGQLLMSDGYLPGRQGDFASKHQADKRMQEQWFSPVP